MTQYTQSDVDELLAKMGTERSALLTAAESLSDADADRVPQDAEGEEQWTAKEQLAHLWEMEHAYIAWVRAAVAEDGAVVDGMRGDSVAIPIEDAPAHSIEELVSALREERERTVAYIRSLSLPEFERRASTRVFGELTAMQWLRSFYRHDRQHMAQIEGRRSDYVPNFKGGPEPNQRQMRIEAVASRRGVQTDEARTRSGQD